MAYRKIGWIVASCMAVCGILYWNATNTDIPYSEPQQPEAQEASSADLLAIAILYLRGNPARNIAPNQTFARHLLERVIDHADDMQAIATAYVELGHIYLLGWGVNPDYVRARQYYEMAAQQRVNIIQTIVGYEQLGDMYFSPEILGPNIPEAMRFYTEAIRLATEYNMPAVAAHAHMQMGNLYYYGNQGVPINYVLARQHFEHVANQNTNLADQGRAHLLLGVIYSLGEGVERNYDRAQEHYRLLLANNAARDHWPAALNGLGQIAYRHGDYQSAFNYFTQALTYPDELIRDDKYIAYLHLGIIYYLGLGVIKNNATARQYLQAVMRDPDALQAERQSAQKYLDYIEAEHVG